MSLQFREDVFSRVGDAILCRAQRRVLTHGRPRLTLLRGTSGRDKLPTYQAFGSALTHTALAVSLRHPRRGGIEP